MNPLRLPRASPVELSWACREAAPKSIEHQLEFDCNPTKHQSKIHGTSIQNQLKNYSKTIGTNIRKSMANEGMHVDTAKTPNYTYFARRSAGVVCLIACIIKTRKKESPPPQKEAKFRAFCWFRKNLQEMQNLEKSVEKFVKSTPPPIKFICDLHRTRGRRKMVLERQGRPADNFF